MRQARQTAHCEDIHQVAAFAKAESCWTGQGIATMSATFVDAAKLGVTITAASGVSLATDGVKDGKAHID